MTYLMIMAVVNGFSHVTDDPTGCQFVQSSIIVPNLTTMAVFHHQIELLLCLENLIQSDDVGVIQSLQDIHLLYESITVCYLFLLDYLDGSGDACADLGCLDHLAKLTLAN